MVFAHLSQNKKIQVHTKGISVDLLNFNLPANKLTAISVLQASSDHYVYNIIRTKLFIGIGTRLLDHYGRLVVISGDRYKRVPLYAYIKGLARVYVSLSVCPQLNPGC